MMGPLGLLAPHPGVSYLFAGQDSSQKVVDEGEGSLWGIANAHTASHGYGSAMGSPPPSWTPALGDMVLKVDAKFKVFIDSVFAFSATYNNTNRESYLRC